VQTHLQECGARARDGAAAGARRSSARRACRKSRPRRAAEARRSLAIREVDAGSCNACELEIHALNNAFYDLERFGLRFVASPRHADVLLVTGPVTKNMREALERTYAATPDPK
jgi:NADH:ubiquinone oxidoreductase subunit B-like Fe-S oxidoreductase